MLPQPHPAQQNGRLKRMQARKNPKDPRLPLDTKLRKPRSPGPQIQRIVEHGSRLEIRAVRVCHQRREAEREPDYLRALRWEVSGDFSVGEVQPAQGFLVHGHDAGAGVGYGGEWRREGDYVAGALGRYDHVCEAEVFEDWGLGGARGNGAVGAEVEGERAGMVIVHVFDYDCLAGFVVGHFGG